jgi:hypothetical protein
MDQFVELLKESVITQFIITVLVVAAMVYMAVTEMVIPEELGWAVSAVLGFYFGSKIENRKVSSAVQNIAKREAKKAMKKE